MRSRMRLSAWATKRISSGPRSGSGAVALFRLKLSAALANADSGALTLRAAQRPSRVTLMTANDSVIIHGPPQNGGEWRSGATSADTAVPSGSAMPILRATPFGVSTNIR